MPLAHSNILEHLRTPSLLGSGGLPLTGRVCSSLELLLFATVNSPRGPTGALPAGKSNPPYPGESEITFQWNYVCPIEKPCTFNCRGAGGGGGSDHVTHLDIYLGTLPLETGNQERAAAYDFSSREFPHSAGFFFAISAG